MLVHTINSILKLYPFYSRAKQKMLKIMTISYQNILCFMKAGIGRLQFQNPNLDAPDFKQN
jgi:hypothetical protein